MKFCGHSFNAIYGFTHDAAASWIKLKYIAHHYVIHKDEYDKVFPCEDTRN